MHRITVFAILLLNAAAGVAGAQRYLVRRYGVRDGLPSAEVNAACQDESGLIWFATRRGIVSYDGRSWSVATGGGLSVETNCLEMTRDAHGRIWALGRNDVFVLGDGRWRTLPRARGDVLPAEAEPIALVTVESDGATLVAAAYRNGTVLVRSDGAWAPLVLPPGVHELRAAAGIGGRLWIASPDRLFSWRPADGEPVEIPVSGRGGLLGLVPSPDEVTLWIVTKTGIARLDAFESGRPAARGVEMVLHDPETLSSLVRPDDRVVGADVGREEIVFGSFRRLYLYSPLDGLRRLTRANGMSGGGAEGVFVDREGNTWITHLGGIDKLVSRRFATFDSAHGLAGDEVAAILERRDGRFVVGHDGAVSILGGEHLAAVSLKTEAGRGRVLDIAEDHDEVLWLAADYDGLARIGSDGAIEWIAALKGRQVTSVRLDDRGRLVVAAEDGLFRMENGVLREIPFPIGLRRRRVVRKLADTGDGGLYLLTAAAGVLVMRGDEITALEHTEALESAYAALVDHSGNRWIGTWGGLARVHGDSYSPCESPRVRRPVYSLLEDSAGRLWIGTDRGVYRWDGERLEHFGLEHGLAGLECNRSALIEDRRGRIWIGTDGGLTVYRPELDRRSTGGPRVELVSIESGGTKCPLDEPVEVAHDSQWMIFEVRATSFVDERNVLFQTRLEGRDDDWSEPCALPLREIRLGRLPPGQYRLHVRAIDVEGRVSRAAQSPLLVIRDPLWAQPWFISVVVAVTLLAGFAGWSYRTQRSYARRLRAEILDRTGNLRRAERAHARAARIDSLGILAGGIAHDFNNLLTAIVGNLSMAEEAEDLESARESIGFAATACERAQSLTRQLLTFARGGQPVREVAAVGKLLREAVEFSLLGSGIERRIDVPDDLPLVDVDVGQMHQAINNVVVNARQAMNESGVLTVRARAVGGDDDQARAVTIEITDSGCGIPAEELERIFEPYYSTKSEGTGLGLAVTHSVIQRHGGSIGITSRPGEGTSFRIVIPVSRASREAVAPESRATRQLRGRVLVMDDEEPVRRLARLALERLGCRVAETADGAAAVDAYREAKESGDTFDAVILDLTVPGGMGGLEAARRIRSYDEHARLIVSSGYSIEAAIADHEAHGFRARLPKPFSIHDLARVVATQMDPR